jgi:membrane-bound metal-dependent hydrolase YbcI (DUF457 family)
VLGSSKSGAAWPHLSVVMRGIFVDFSQCVKKFRGSGGLFAHHHVEMRPVIRRDKMATVLTALHFLTHVGQSWIVANLGPGSAKDRCLVVLAGVLLDLDGVGILWSQSAYAAMHRAAGHSLLFGLVLVAAAVLWADARWATGARAALSFLLHLGLDVVGTGGLPIRYLWPITDRSWSYDGHWVLASWPNAAVMAGTLLGVIAVAAARTRRMPR